MNKPKKLTQAEKLANEKLEQDKRRKFNADLLNNNAFANAAVVESFGKGVISDLEIMDLKDNIRNSITLVQEGDLRGLESMLVSQAKSLQVMFVSLARKANVQEYLKQYGTYMNLALKAQSQSRATIQALVELKYPKQVIVTKQANINNGNQQVNNGVAESARAEENQTEPNKLMDIENEATQNHDQKQNIKRLDSRTTGTPVPSHSSVEAVATVHRGKNT
jgi:lactam utilization protein B